MTKSATFPAIPPFLLIFVVALIGMLAPFSIDTYLPSFPAIEADLHVSREWLTQSLSIYLLCFAVATLIWGPLSDRFGRRLIILTSLIGYLLASILCALASSYEMLLLGRALQGLMVAGSMVASRAMIRDYFSSQEAQRAMALMMMLFAVAPALAPIIGGWLEVTFGWRSVFYFLALYGLSLLLLFYLRIAETQNPEHIQSIHPVKLTRSYWESLRHPQYLKLVIAQGCLVGGFFVYVAGSTSLIYDHLHLGEQDFWVFFVPLVTGILLGSLSAHRLSHRLPGKSIINLALALGGTSVILNVLIEVSVEPNTVLVVAPLVLYAFSFALANPAFSVAALDCLPQKRGMASSIQSLFQMGTAGVITALVVPYVHHSLQAMAIAQALLISISILLWLMVRNQLPRHNDD